VQGSAHLALLLRRLRQLKRPPLCISKESGVRSYACAAHVGQALLHELPAADRHKRRESAVFHFRGSLGLAQLCTTALKLVLLLRGKA
jgi:hypothetical protein